MPFFPQTQERVLGWVDCAGDLKRKGRKAETSRGDILEWGLTWLAWILGHKEVVGEIREHR